MENASQELQSQADVALGRSRLAEEHLSQSKLEAPFLARFPGQKLRWNRNVFLYSAALKRVAASLRRELRGWSAARQGASRRDRRLLSEV